MHGTEIVRLQSYHVNPCPQENSDGWLDRKQRDSNKSIKPTIWLQLSCREITTDTMKIEIKVVMMNCKKQAFKYIVVKYIVPTLGGQDRILKAQKRFSAFYPWSIS